MRNILLKLGAVASIATGAALLSQPASATTWQKCIGGGYHDVQRYDSCHTETSDTQVDVARNAWVTQVRPGGICGAYRDPAGYYCADQTQAPTTCNKDAKELRYRERYAGACRIDISYTKDGKTISGKGAQLSIGEYTPGPDWMPGDINTVLKLISAQNGWGPISYSVPCDMSAGEWDFSDTEVYVGMCHPIS